MRRYFLKLSPFKMEALFLRCLAQWGLLEHRVQLRQRRRRFREGGDRSGAGCCW
jgi:hypothetical protein